MYIDCSYLNVLCVPPVVSSREAPAVRVLLIVIGGEVLEIVRKKLSVSSKMSSSKIPTFTHVLFSPNSKITESLVRFQSTPKTARIKKKRSSVN